MGWATKQWPSFSNHFQYGEVMIRRWRSASLKGYSIMDHPWGAGWTSPCPVALTRGIDIRAIAKLQPIFLRRMENGFNLSLWKVGCCDLLSFWGLLYDLLVSLSITLFGTQDKPSFLQTWRKNAIWVWLAHRSMTVNLARSKEKSLSLYGFWWECKCN